MYIHCILKVCRISFMAANSKKKRYIRMYLTYMQYCIPTVLVPYISSKLLVVRPAFIVYAP